MKGVIKFIKWFFIIITVFVLIFLSWFYITYSGKGKSFPALATAPQWPEDSLKIVATLPEPPGNLAVSQEGRIFCTYHAEGRPEIKVWELVDGKPVPFPNTRWQSNQNGKVFLGDIFNIRIDSKNRLWTVDHGFHGIKFHACYVLILTRAPWFIELISTGKFVA